MPETSTHTFTFVPIGPEFVQLVKPEERLGSVQNELGSKHFPFVLTPPRLGLRPHTPYSLFKTFAQINTPLNPIRVKMLTH